MGLRLTHNLKDSNYDMSYLEVSQSGKERLHEKGIIISEQNKAVPNADVLILAVPDVALGNVSSGIIPKMKSGALVVTLDPSAALAGKLFDRLDIAYFITHPAHPSIFNWEPIESAMKDHFGGVAAKQAIVCALLKGTDSDYLLGETLAKTFYAPVSRSHKIITEQMGL